MCFLMFYSIKKGIFKRFVGIPGTYSEAPAGALELLAAGAVHYCVLVLILVY